MSAAVERTEVIGGRTASERGYAIVFLAFILLPLMALAAVGVDIGVWYLQAQKNQRIADSAALAGVVWMPDEATALATVDEAVARNGLSPGVDSTVVVTPLGRDRLKVQVSTKSELSFARMFLGDFSITRSAIAEYNPPIAMGSPENNLGDPSLWLAVSGRCSVRENGDLRMAQWVAGYPGGAYPPSNCSGSPNVEATGSYLYAVTIESEPAGPVTIEAYDATFSPSATSETDIEFRPAAQFDTEFVLYDADGAAFDLASRTVLTTATVSSRNAAYAGTWRTIGVIADPEPGTYYLRVRATGGGMNSFGSNGFGLRASAGMGYVQCTTLVGRPGYDATCPQVSAVEDLSMYASLSGGSSTFYLAEIPASNAGKQLEISLFDVGEGAERIEILDPNGQPAFFEWSTDCSVGLAPNGGCSGSGTALDVSGDGQQVYAATLSTSRYNDRTVVATVDLPNDYATAYAGEWWQIRYTFGASITDRTTWSVRMLGDPVRLAG